MFRLELTENERYELLHVVSNYASHLRLEIAHTDHRAFKEMLHSREQVLTRLLEKLQEAEEPIKAH